MKLSRLFEQLPISVEHRLTKLQQQGETSQSQKEERTTLLKHHLLSWKLEANCEMCLYHLGILGIYAHNVYIVPLRTSAGTEKCRGVVSLSHVCKCK